MCQQEQVKPAFKSCWNFRKWCSLKFLKCFPACVSLFIGVCVNVPLGACASSWERCVCTGVGVFGELFVMWWTELHPWRGHGRLEESNQQKFIYKMIKQWRHTILTELQGELKKKMKVNKQKALENNRISSGISDLGLVTSINWQLLGQFGRATIPW